MKTIKFSIFAFAMVLSFTFLFVKCSEEKTQAAPEISLNQRTTSETAKIEAFVAYLTREKLLDNSISVNFEKSFIDVADNAEIIYIVVSNDYDGGVIKGIKTSAQGQRMVPQHKEYLIVYEQYSNLSETAKTANIDAYDWNYGKLFYHAEIADTKILNETLYPVTTSPTTAVNSGAGLPSSCTGGADGNVSWGECMDCTMTVCHQDPNCRSICKAVDKLSDIFGLLGGRAPGCKVSLAISCISVAIIY